MESHREGKITEYRNGTHFLTHIKWEDGHEEIEVHQCSPKLIFQSYDPKDINGALEKLKDIKRLPSITTCVQEEKGE